MKQKKMKAKKQTKKVSLKRQIGYFVIYMTLFATLGAFIDYYAYDIISPWIFIGLSFLGAIWATYVHVKYHKKNSKVDDLEKTLEEII